MNVPFLKAKRFQVEERVNDAVDKISQWSPIKPWVKGFGDKWERLVHHFEFKETPSSSSVSPVVSPTSPRSPSYATSSGDESSGEEDNSSKHNN